VSDDLDELLRLARERKDHRLAAILRRAGAKVGRKRKGNRSLGMIPVSPLPNAYDRSAVQSAIESLERTRAKAANVQASSTNAGTQVGVNWPSEDDAVPLELTISATMDRFVSGGPARIWTARAGATGTARYGFGPQRYRIVLGGQRLGVMSLRLPPDADMGATIVPGILVQHGIVVTGIPHWLGRPPRRILAAESVGDSPVSFRTLFSTGGAAVWNSGGTTRDFYWKRTQDEHVTLAPYPFASAFGSDSTLQAGSAQLRDMKGFTLSLLTGTSGGEVFRQLCSRACLGRSLRGDGHGPSATVPSGLPVEAPTVSTAVDWLSPTSYTHRIEGYDLTTARIAQGVPFSYEDCRALAATSETFSLVVQASGEKIVSQSPAPTYGTPAVWHQNGLVIQDSTTGRLRSWALDIIVE
jgi:hypothetical protein